VMVYFSLSGSICFIFWIVLEWLIASRVLPRLIQTPRWKQLMVLLWTMLLISAVLLESYST